MRDNFFVLGVIGSIIGGISIILIGNFENGYTFLIGLVTLGIGLFISWFSSCLIYGFGELIEKTTEISKNLKSMNQKPIGPKQKHMKEKEITEDDINRLL